MENEPQKTAFAYLEGNPPRVSFMGTVCETPEGASFTVTRPLPKSGIGVSRAKRAFAVIGFLAAIMLGLGWAGLSDISRDTFGTISFFAGWLVSFVLARL
jgi:hypothetical protein